ncbi:hypothetical protein J6590_059625 [Homalodisca vitripennis]|nr:hypothetical protein J6590_059625 [Homalodisca vitripennis]
MLGPNKQPIYFPIGSITLSELVPILRRTLTSQDFKALFVSGNEKQTRGTHSIGLTSGRNIAVSYDWGKPSACVVSRRRQGNVFSGQAEEKLRIEDRVSKTTARKSVIINDNDGGSPRDRDSVRPDTAKATTRHRLP